MQIPKPPRKKKRSEMSFTELLELKKDRKKLRTQNKRKAHKGGNFSNSELLGVADQIFSLYIRLRDANSDCMVMCCTCPKILPIKKIENGHLVTRTFLPLRFDPLNCDSQCHGCNHKSYGNGRYEDHAKYILDRKGIDAIDHINRVQREELLRQYTSPIKEPLPLLYRRVIEEYTPIVEELAEKIGFTIEGTHKTLINKARKICTLPQQLTEK